MTRTKFIAGNWKMNNTAQAAATLIEGLKAGTADMAGVDVVICPTFLSIPTAVVAAKGTPIKVGSQNIHWAKNGAFTGEISAEMLNEAGVEYAIIGHSERRQYFGETDETVNQRTKAALAANIIPITCVGETLADREAGTTNAVIEIQIRKGFAGLTAEEMAKTVIAYEPVWAIGTGKVATDEQAQEVHAFIRSLVAEIFGQNVADAVRILYGGSMKPGNAAGLLAQKDIDGGLIGGAALKAEDFLGIIKAAK